MTGGEILKLRRELISLPEYTLEAKLGVLQYSVYVFEQNYTQLRELLDVCKDYEKALTLLDVTNSDAHEAFLLEITRLFHNFIASVKSLIDHTRILFRDLYSENDKFPEYQKQVDTQFAENSLAQFVEDLRDYCLHYSTLPVFSKEEYVAAPPKFEITIRVNVATLNKWSGWSLLGREYLKTQEKSIDVADIATRYHELAVDFHRWMRSRQTEIHKEDFKRLDEKKQELAKILIPDEVRFALADIGQYTLNPDKAFYRLLNAKQREKLAKISLNSNEHVEQLLDVIQEQAHIGEELRNKIRDIYKKFTR